jgi:hypothetical protein
MSLREKVASLLEALADQHDANPSGPVIAEPEENAVEKFAATYRNITGEDLAPELRDRLEGDDVLREAISKVANQNSRRPTPLGEAADSDSSREESRGKTKEAAEREAYEKFAQGILAIGQR